LIANGARQLIGHTWSGLPSPTKYKFILCADVTEKNGPEVQNP
jgi:hypothetical protein